MLIQSYVNIVVKEKKSKNEPSEKGGEYYMEKLSRKIS